MRNENEKKSITKSVKLTADQEKMIKEEAEKKNMTFSAYMVDCAVHGNNTVTPLLAVKVQTMMNLLGGIMENMDIVGYNEQEKISLLADEFYRDMYHVPPEERIEEFEQRVGLFMEGGNSIWESLK